MTKSLKLVNLYMYRVRRTKMLVYTLQQRACDRLTEIADFCRKKITFSKKAHFDVGGYVNK